MIPKRLLSNEKLKKLGWKPKYDLRSGLENAQIGIKNTNTNMTLIQNLKL